MEGGGGEGGIGVEGVVRGVGVKMNEAGKLQ